MIPVSGPRLRLGLRSASPPPSGRSPLLDPAPFPAPVSCPDPSRDAGPERGSATRPWSGPGGRGGVGTCRRPARRPDLAGGRAEGSGGGLFPALLELHRLVERRDVAAAEGTRPHPLDELQEDRVTRVHG